MRSSVRLRLGLRSSVRLGFGRDGRLRFGLGRDGRFVRRERNSIGHNNRLRPRNIESFGPGEGNGFAVREPMGCRLGSRHNLGPGNDNLFLPGCREGRLRTIEAVLAGRVREDIERTRGCVGTPWGREGSPDLVRRGRTPRCIGLRWCHRTRATSRPSWRTQWTHLHSLRGLHRHSLRRTQGHPLRRAHLPRCDRIRRLRGPLDRAFREYRRAVTATRTLPPGLLHRLRHSIGCRLRRRGARSRYPYEAGFARS